MMLNLKIIKILSPKENQKWLLLMHIMVIFRNLSSQQIVLILNIGNFIWERVRVLLYILELIKIMLILLLSLVVFFLWFSIQSDLLLKKLIVSPMKRKFRKRFTILILISFLKRIKNKRKRRLKIHHHYHNNLHRLKQVNHSSKELLVLARTFLVYRMKSQNLLILI